MEISVIGSSQVNLGRNSDLGPFNFSKNLNAKIFNLKINSNFCNFGQSQRLTTCPSKSATGLTLRASANSRDEADVISENDSNFTRDKPIDGVKLCVGMPLDTISVANKPKHVRAIFTGLKALKLLGVQNVELPIWWGIVEKEAKGKYDWSGYLAIVEIVQKLGLKINISLCFHASQEAKIPLPQWVTRIGESDPSIYFTDRSGKSYKDCLSLGVDDLPVLEGKTPVEVYGEFCESFKSSFSSLMGSTVTAITIGLGPNGELRYPSHHHPSKNKNHFGAGEFQCYDKNMLENLKKHAEASGNPLWGLGGPHDAPTNDQSPISTGFFAENSGSWESPYGDFFLSWYSNMLISHGDRILSLAASTFKNIPVTLSGKVPIMPSWHKTRSHPSELTAGFYNTEKRDGYEGVSVIFSKSSCKIVLPGMDLSDECQPIDSRSSPELLLNQIKTSCKKHGVEVWGTNSSFSGDLRWFQQIKKNLVDENARVELFTYQRMGAYFFSPEHFHSFAQFVHGLNQPDRSLDDLAMEDEETVVPICGVNLQMQVA